ncbi:unnamed protein product [Urochloa humidicola]
MVTLEHYTPDLQLLLDGGEDNLTMLDLRHQEVNGTMPRPGELQVLGYGTVRTSQIQVSKVGYVEGAAENVISARRLAETDGLEVPFEQQRFRVKDQRTGRVVGQARLRGGVYLVDYILLQEQQDDASSFHTSTPAATVENKKEKEDEGGEWILDLSGLYHEHYTSNLRLLYDLRMDHQEWHGQARGARLNVPDVTYVSKTKTNRISEWQLSVEHGLEVVFERQRCHIKDRYTGEVVGQARLHGNNYVLDYLVIGTQDTTSAISPMTAVADAQEDAGEEGGGAAPAVVGEWVLDSSAEHHHTTDLRLLHDLNMQ